MTPRTTSVAMTADVAETLRSHVDRPDGQEDICLATYRPSTGAIRTTALITSVITPAPGEREVHGNASILGYYVLRASAPVHGRGEGLALCHSHPGGRGWQAMSGPDFDAEHAFATLIRELTGHPLAGVTYSGRDQSWPGHPANALRDWCRFLLST
jgi:molybdopterin-synthase adenylyltransferase